MGFRVILAWLARSALSLCLFGVLFSLFANLDTNNVVTLIFSEVYDHATAESRANLDIHMRQDWCGGQGIPECGQENNKALFLAFVGKAAGENKLPSLDLRTYLLPLTIVILLLLTVLYFLEKKPILMIWHLEKLALHVGISCLVAFLIGTFFIRFFPPQTSILIDAITGSTFTPEIAKQVAFTLVPVVLKYVFGVAFLYAGISLIILSTLLMTLTRRYLVEDKKTAKVVVPPSAN